MTEKNITSQRGSVYYWISRSADENAECLIFLHGLTADHTLFEKQLDFFSDKYTVLAWDAPAHAKSRPYSDFNYANTTEELHTILLSENITRAVFIGQSMGGYVIQAFMLEYPEFVKAFVAIDTCPFGLKYYSKSDFWWLRQMEWMTMCYPHKTLIKAIAKQSTVNEYSYKNMLTALEQYPKKELCRLIGQGYSGFIDVCRDMKISCPVIILVGEKDRTGKVRKYCDEWHKSEGYPLYVIKNAAHNSNLDNYERTNEIIEDFLKRMS